MRGRTGNPPKPANSFICFRADFMRRTIPSDEQKMQGNVSKLAREKWNWIKENDPKEHRYWILEAQKLARDFHKNNPEYVSGGPSRRGRRGQRTHSPIDTDSRSATDGEGSSHPQRSSRDIFAFRHQQHLTPASFAPPSRRSPSPTRRSPSPPRRSPSRSPSPAPTEVATPPASPLDDDILFETADLEIEVGSYDNMITMLDFHERGIDASMSKINKRFFD